VWSLDLLIKSIAPLMCALAVAIGVRDDPVFGALRVLVMSSSEVCHDC
jgi:hypothetical protein